MKKLVITCLLLLGVCKAEEAQKYTQQPLWDTTLDHAKIEYQLQTEPIIELMSMKKYLWRLGRRVKFRTRVYIATLKNGLKAVFKPEEKLHDSYGERAAYKASMWLGLRLVPPTVIREYNGRKGSLQFFVKSHFDLLYSHSYKRAFKRLSAKTISDMKLFYFIFGQWDTHPGNQLVALGADGNAYLALIDNAFFLGPYRPMDNRLLRVYSSATLKQYENLTLEALRWIFEDALSAGLCSSRFFDRILKRRDQVLALPGKQLIP